MSNIITIDELKKRFMEKNSLADWKLFSEEQSVLLVKYEKEIYLLKEKNISLEKMLSQSLISELTPEEIVCIQQIDRLKVMSNERQLTLEEVKKLDLLVKNLKLIREESTIVLNTRSSNVSEDELVAIAQSETRD